MPMRTQSIETQTNDFIDAIIIISTEWGWAIDNILEMPISRWIKIQERLPFIKRKKERAMKHGR